MYQLVFFVPEVHRERVKEALFGAGAGSYGAYDHCSWETAGTGQFRPLDGSRPFVGAFGEVSRVTEFRVEMLCRDECLARVIDELRRAHPYEEPSYYAVKIETADTIAR